MQLITNLICATWCVVLKPYPVVCVVSQSPAWSRKLGPRTLLWFFQRYQISLQQQLQRVSCWCSCWPGTSVLVVKPCLKASSLQRVNNFTCKWWHQTKQSPAIYSQRVCLVANQCVRGAGYNRPIRLMACQPDGPSVILCCSFYYSAFPTNVGPLQQACMLKYNIT